jgi:hypothetical protein
MEIIAGDRVQFSSSARRMIDTGEMNLFLDSVKSERANSKAECFMVTYHSARLLMNSLLLQRDGEEQDFVSIIVVTMRL